MLEHPSASVWSVYDLTLYIKNLIDQDATLRNIWVRGEISNFKHHSRGHMYFTLKDEQAKILAVMFQGYNRFLKFQPKDGLKVLVRGEISLYERDGQYQIYVKEMQTDGIGNLYLAFEQLKEKLASEGLFDPKHKRALPAFPKNIALITSPTGAAIRDMLTTLKRRYPWAHVYVIPVLVQGEHAPKSLVQAIDIANRFGSLDVIIIGRGGGSIEELWAFNEEIVARSIFQSKIPIISAVGHETDYTIADFVADIRAATPTAAAEIAVPHIRDLEDRINGLKKRLQHSVRSLLQSKKQMLSSLKRSPYFRRPAERLVQYEQRLDFLSESLQKCMNRFPKEKRQQLTHLVNRFQRTGLQAKVMREKERVSYMNSQLSVRFSAIYKEKRTYLGYMIHQMDALSPLSTLKRGYTFARKDNQLIKSIKQLNPGDALQIHFYDGIADTSIWGLKEEEK